MINEGTLAWHVVMNMNMNMSDTYVIVIPEFFAISPKANAKFDFIRCWWQSVFERERIV